MGPYKTIRPLGPDSTPSSVWPDLPCSFVLSKDVDASQLGSSVGFVQHTTKPFGRARSTLFLFEASTLRFRFNRSLVRHLGMALDMEHVADSVGELQIPS